MKKGLLFLFFILSSGLIRAQSITDRLRLAVDRLETDSQLVHAILGFEVMDAATGMIIYRHNASIGLAPASCQKLFTSVAAFEWLGPAFRYTTRVLRNGNIDHKILHGDLVITGSGDPSFGSWRWNETQPKAIWASFDTAMQQLGIDSIDGRVLADNHPFPLQPIPDGWIWEDIGNYYGAGTWALNWHENQYDLVLSSGARTGDSVTIGKVDPPQILDSFVNEMKAGEKNTGDNTSIFLPPYSRFGFASGTIPRGEKNFLVSGSIPDAPKYLAHLVNQELKNLHIGTRSQPGVSTDMPVDWADSATVWTYYSPAFDTLNFWFLRKSINLYGEAFARTLGLQQKQEASTEAGIEAILDFWEKAGIDRAALHILDGSGLSPQNRVTAHALVQALHYAQSKNWYPSFYRALPEFNGMKMKSGSIGGARSFSGYHRSHGREYIFSIIVNNYDGSSTTMVRKLWKVLDTLK